MLVTAKDKDGHTFDTIESLKFETKVRKFKRCCKSWFYSILLIIDLQNYTEINDSDIA